MHFHLHSYLLYILLQRIHYIQKIYYNAVQFCVLCLFPSWFPQKNIQKKTRHFERSSCHFFFKESTFLERAPKKEEKKKKKFLRASSLCSWQDGYIFHSGGRHRFS